MIGSSKRPRRSAELRPAGFRRSERVRAPPRNFDPTNATRQQQVLEQQQEKQTQEHATQQAAQKQHADQKGHWGALTDPKSYDMLNR
jgi:hypothetical protein